VSDAAEEWIEVDDSPEALLELLEERGWGDGLPVVAPTAERVDRMLQTLDTDPDEAIAVLPPRNGAATGRAIAVNAVLAGCPPDVMPVLMAAARALASPELNLEGVQATTHPVAPSTTSASTPASGRSARAGAPTRPLVGLSASCSCTSVAPARAPGMPAHRDSPASTRSASPRTRPIRRGLHIPGRRA